MAAAVPALSLAWGKVNGEGSRADGMGSACDSSRPVSTSQWQAGKYLFFSFAVTQRNRGLRPILVYASGICCVRESAVRWGTVWLRFERFGSESGLGIPTKHSRSRSACDLKVSTISHNDELDVDEDGATTSTTRAVPRRFLFLGRGTKRGRPHKGERGEAQEEEA